MDTELIKEISAALESYRAAIARTLDPEAKEDYQRVARTVENLLSALRSDEVDEVKLLVLSFSRQVTDAYSAQPPEFAAMDHKVNQVRKKYVR